MELPVRIKEALSPTVTLDEVTFVADSSGAKQPEHIQDIMPDPQQHLAVGVHDNLPAAHFQLQPGNRFNIKERDLQKLDRRGGFGVVLLGKDNNLNQDVAVKFLRPSGLRPANDPEATLDYSQRQAVQEWRDKVNDFYREARIVANAQHHHIVKVYGLVGTKLHGEIVPGLVMEKLEPLRKNLRTNEVVTMVNQVGSALDFLHSKGLFHEDVKPENILTRDNNGNNEYVLSDFGAVHKAHLEDNEYNLSFGTSGYIDPQGENPSYGADTVATKHYADQYALAVSTYRLLTGGKGEVDVKLRINDGKLDGFIYLQGGDNIPDEVKAVLQRATSFHREDRYDDCATFAKALAEAVERSQMGKMKGITPFTREMFAKIMGGRNSDEPQSARESLQTIAGEDHSVEQSSITSEDGTKDQVEEVHV